MKRRIGGTLKPAKESVISTSKRIFWNSHDCLNTLGEMLRETLDRCSFRQQITTEQGPLRGPSVRGSTCPGDRNWSGANFLSCWKRYEGRRGQWGRGERAHNFHT